MNINKKYLTKGSIWLVNLDPVVGREQAKKRPCLIVSTNTFNDSKYDLVCVLPITSKFRDLWWFVELQTAESGLPIISYVICNQVRTVSVERLLGKPFGIVSDKSLNQVTQRLKILLDL